MRSFPPYRSARPRGMTMVEVVVVIGVMAGMAIAIVPSLKHAREAAYQVMCMNQLRQKGIMSSRHLMDHEGVLPKFFYDATVTDESTSLNVVPRDGRASSWQSYQPDLFVDPAAEEYSDVPLLSGDGTIKRKPTSYSYNIDLFQCIRNFADLEKVGQLSEITVFYDGAMGEDTAGVYAGGGDFASQHVSYRHAHQREANVLYADWHVESTDDLAAGFLRICEGASLNHHAGHGFGGGAGSPVGPGAGGGGDEVWVPEGEADGPAGDEGPGSDDQGDSPGANAGNQDDPGDQANGSNENGQGGPGNSGNGAGGPGGDEADSDGNGNGNSGNGGPGNNNGHGNNEDGVDSSNPGNAPFDDSDPNVDDEAGGGQGAAPSQGNGPGHGNGNGNVDEEGDTEFEVSDDGSVTPQEDFELSVQIIGTQITYGGIYDIPVTASVNVGGQAMDLWGDPNSPTTGAVQAEDEPNVLGTFSAGSEIRVTGNSWVSHDTWSPDYEDDGNWNSHLSAEAGGDNNQQVAVLRNGDSVPGTPGFQGQNSISELVAPFVGSDGRIAIGENQVIYLAELGMTDLGSPAADFQDLVVLATMNPAE